MSTNIFKTEDLWATFVGLFALAAVWFAWQAGSPLASFVATNGAGLHWHTWPVLLEFFRHNDVVMLLQFAIFLACLILPIALMGLDAELFVVGFAAMFLLSVLIFVIAGWAGAAQFELEPPVVALLVGLAVANTVGTPPWLRPAMRVELYLKIGIVLLGASFPLSLLYSAGPTALAQSAIITIVTVGVIYGLGRTAGLSHAQSAVLGTAAGVCGVSASMAAGASVNAKRHEIHQAISLVILFSLIWVVVLPQLAFWLGATAGQGGAWIGSSELADAAGAAAASSFGQMVHHLDLTVKAFTLTKVIGRDVWIGLWAFFWSLVTVWRDRQSVSVNAGEVAVTWWQRMPKFIVGFLLAAVIMSALTTHLDHTITHRMLDPLTGLRTWAFTLCFLSIGLNTRIRQFLEIDRRVLRVFSVGVLLNLVLGYLLSTQIFGAAWAALH
ncbi:MAG: YeiH family protein [Acidiferrobacter sp.]